jgi:hypothetical protein
MRRLLVGRRGKGGSVDLDQHEPSGIVLLLKHVELRDAWLLHAVPRVLDASGLEGIHMIGFHQDMDVDDQHETLTPLGEIEIEIESSGAPKAQRAAAPLRSSAPTHC